MCEGITVVFGAPSQISGATYTDFPGESRLSGIASIELRLPAQNRGTMAERPGFRPDRKGVWGLKSAPPARDRGRLTQQKLREYVSERPGQTDL